MATKGEVLLDTAGEMPEPSIDQRVLLIGHPLDQIPVVRSHQECARP